MAKVLLEAWGSEAEQRRIRDIVQDVLDASERNSVFERHLAALGSCGNPRLLCAVFEALAWRIAITNSWIPYLAAEAYDLLGRKDAAFLTAASALRIHPETTGASRLNLILFDFYVSRGRADDARAVSNAQNALAPLHPLAPADDIVAQLAAGEPNGRNSDPAVASHQDSLDGIVEEIMAAPDPEGQLLAYLAKFEVASKQALACSVFESVVWRLPLRNYWTFYRAFTCYRSLGRHDASFLMAATSDQIGPKYSGAYGTGREMFSYFRDQGRPKDAIDVFLSHAERFPSKPVAALWEVWPLFGAAGVSTAAIVGPSHPGADETLRRDMVIVEEEKRAPWTCPVYGGRPAPNFDYLAKGLVRPAVHVACIDGGELLIDNEAFVVCDANGDPHADLSVHDFPLLLKSHIEGLEAAGAAVEHIELDTAVVISDRFYGPPNLCHFLLDHFTRLEIYSRAGIDLATATVIGGAPTADFQTLALAKCGVQHFLPTGRTARVRIRRLLVSTNCRGLRHPAHDGAKWAIDFIRRVLVPAPPPPTRKLYVSRRDASARRVVNEAELMVLLQARGFELIVPGELSFSDQLAIFASATHVIGPHGAGLTNIVASQPGTHVLEFFHPLYGTISYASFAEAGGLRYSALVGSDGYSDAPELNDATAVDLAKGAWGSRDLRVDVQGVAAWLDQIEEDALET